MKMSITQVNLKAWDTDYGSYVPISEDNIVDALYWAWNYEFDVYDENNDLVFAPWEDNAFNSDLLEPFGLRVIEQEKGKGRAFQSIESGEVFIQPWREE